MRDALEEYPFDLPIEQIETHMDRMVTVTISSLSSFYLELPRGPSFLEYDPFRRAYDDLRMATLNFKALDRHVVREAVEQNGLILVVLRCIVGLSPPELADMASELSGETVSQSFARSEDQNARRGEMLLAKGSDTKKKRIVAMIDAACSAIEKGPENPSPLLIHRLHKVDTEQGLASVQHAASNGVEYSALLYERMLGRPFATHRDAVSELVGDIVEKAVIDVLTTAQVPFYKTGRAEKIAGFDQAADFFIPNAEDPKVVIEAKLTQDDGTARDKVTRVQHLSSLSDGGKRFEVIACIDGRGFKIRREDMRKLIRATGGKVFSVATMSHLVEKTSLRDFAGKTAGQ